MYLWLLTMKLKEVKRVGRRRIIHLLVQGQDWNMGLNLLSLITDKWPLVAVHAENDGVGTSAVAVLEPFTFTKGTKAENKMF